MTFIDTFMQAATISFPTQCVSDCHVQARVRVRVRDCHVQARACVRDPCHVADETEAESAGGRHGGMEHGAWSMEHDA